MKKGFPGWWLILALAAVISGCAGHREPDWPSLIGKMTYDEVLLELGPPSHVASLTDGTKVAEWLQYGSRVISTSGPIMGGWGPYGGWSAPAVSSTPSVYLLLTFAPDDKLAAARRVYR